MKRFITLIVISFLISNISKANFKEIKKKAAVNNPEIIFPIPKNLDNYQKKIISNFDNVLKRNAGTSSWTVIEPRCHFTK